MTYAKQRRDPRTKEAVLDRMLSYDFTGDIRDIGAETARLTRTGANRMLMTFPATGITYELVIRRPRAENRPSETRSFAPKDGERYLSPEEARDLAKAQEPADEKSEETATPRRRRGAQVRVQA